MGTIESACKILLRVFKVHCKRTDQSKLIDNYNHVSYLRIIHFQDHKHVM